MIILSLCHRLQVTIETVTISQDKAQSDNENGNDSNEYVRMIVA